MTPRQFSDALVKFYQTEEGQVGLPFAVFPGCDVLPERACSTRRV